MRWMMMCFVLSTFFMGCGMPAPDTPLTAAAQRGDADAVRELLARGADPDGKDSHGLSALMRASRRGDLRVVGALVDGKANLDLCDNFVNGWTALMHATHKGQIEVIRALLDAGADVNVVTRHGVTALILATGDPRTDIVRLLLERGADARVRSQYGGGPLTNAVGSGRTDNVRALLEKDPGLKLDDTFGDSIALLMARLRGCREIVAMVTRSGARS